MLLVNFLVGAISSHYLKAKEKKNKTKKGKKKEKKKRILNIKELW